MKIEQVEIEGKFYAPIEDGKPVYLAEDGNRVPFDAPGTVATIGRLNGEAKSRREEAENYKTQLARFAGIDDPDMAKKAIETFKNLDQKKLVDAGEVEKIKTEVAKAKDLEIEKWKGDFGKLNSDFDKVLRESAFANSEFIRSECAENYPPVVLAKMFGDNFVRNSEGKLAASVNDEPVWSLKNPGNHADFDEALSIVLNNSPLKNHILKGSQASGAGISTAQSNGSGQKTIKRNDFDQKSPDEQMSMIKSGVTLID